MEISALRARVSRSLVGFAWNEWAQLGVLATPDRESSWAADPEALLVFTLQVARDEPRLFDEVLDWLALNAGLLSLQRLRNQYLDPIDERLGEAALTWAAEHGARVQAGAVPTDKPEQLVFYGARRPSRPDPSFRAFGLLKPPTRRSGKSQAPDLSRPINLAFRLRRIFGVGSRAEVIRFLVTAGVQSPHGKQPLFTTLAIAEAAGYAKRNVQEALSALVETQLVERVTRGNEHLYRVDPEQWRHLIPTAGEQLTYRDWPNALTAFRELHRWLSQPDLPSMSPYLRASEARRLMAQIEPSLSYAGIPTGGGRDAPGAEYWDIFVDTVERALGHRESEMPW